MKNKLKSVLLALALLLNATMPAYASVVTGSAINSVPVDLTVEAPIFSVTISTSLPITLTELGEVQVADNATIINESAGPVKITAIQTLGVGDWETTDFNAFDIGSAKVGGKFVGLLLNIGGNQITTTGKNLNDFMGSIRISKGESLPLICDAKLPAQKEAISGQQIAEVIFTIGWDD